MSIEHPHLRGWFALQDGRNINVSQIVWFRASTRQMIADQGNASDEPTIELMLSNGASIMLDDPIDREAFARMVGTIDSAST